MSELRVAVEGATVDGTVDASFAAAPVPLAVVDVYQGRLATIVRVNAAMCRLTGRTSGDIVGRELADLVHPEDAGLVAEPVLDLIASLEHPQIRVVREGWGVLWTALSLAETTGTGQRSRVVIALTDVSAFRNATEELAHQATHDPLTGLQNRAVLIDNVTRALARLDRRDGSVALLFCDLDGFKHLNDTYGHRFGDAVLQEIAARLATAVRREDLVVRMGGDEFVVVCEIEDSSQEAAMVAERVREALDEPLQVLGRTTGLGVSIGVAQVTDSSASAEDLLRRADLALYRAKERGRNRVEFFAPELEDRARRRVATVDRLREALQNDWIAVDVQSVVDLESGATVGYEALSRIRQPGQPTRYPADFEDAAVQSGLVARLGERVLNLSLAWLAEHRNETAWIAVNVAARELARTDYATSVLEALERNALTPQRLVLEVPESSLVEATGPALITLRRLRNAGVHVSIDDFGTGYSSLTALRDLPADIVKIDQSFIGGLGDDEADDVIVAAVVSVAHQLDRVVIAKGVERPEQAEALREIGCDFVQGYLFSAPHPT